VTHDVSTSGNPIVGMLHAKHRTLSAPMRQLHPGPYSAATTRSARSRWPVRRLGPDVGLRLGARPRAVSFTNVVTPRAPRSRDQHGEREHHDAEPAANRSSAATRKAPERSAAPIGQPTPLAPLPRRPTTRSAARAGRYGDWGRDVGLRLGARPRAVASPMVSTPGRSAIS